ncbi:MAG: M14 family zinc carboxypeptidase, partial [Calditrichota bacterium]
MKSYLFLVVFILIQLSSYQGRAEDWSTYYEESGFKKTPSYLQTINYCQKLDSASKWIKYTSFGKSPQGRDLPLLIVDKHANFTPDKVRASGNAILLIQAGIHSGEIDGKDAGLMLIR